MYQRPLTLSNHLSFRILKAPGFYACCLQAQCRDLYIFTSSIAKKKDTGASSYKVDSNMGILGFFGDVRFLSTKHILSKCSKEHASAHLDKIMNHWRCPSINSVLAVTKLSETKIYIHFIIQYPLHIVLHSGFEFLKLQFFCNPNNQNPLIVCECSRWHGKGLSGWPRVPSENGNASDATKPKQYIEKHKRREILQILSAHAL